MNSNNNYGAIRKDYLSPYICEIAIGTESCIMATSFTSASSLEELERVEYNW